MNKKRRKIYIDCGAWEGDSILAFKKYHKGYEIFGFECEPRLKKDLVALSLKEDFALLFKAAYIQDGPICLYQGIKDFTESSSVYSEKTTYINNKNFIEVKAIDFSQWIIDSFDRNDFIVCKMNIEGAEYDVLEKMIKDGAIHYIDYLFVEWHNKKLNGFVQERHDNLKAKLRKIVTLHDWIFVKNYKVDPFVGLPV
jgi:FkbM family methyltransferase